MNIKSEHSSPAVKKFTKYGNQRNMKKNNKLINENDDEINKKTHFIPIGIKKFIDELFKRSLNSYDFFDEFNKRIHFYSKIRISSVIYSLHKAAKLDHLGIIEYILNNVKNRNDFTNSQCGTMQYTPIFESAYNGSIRASKMLMIAGADITIKNKKNESVLEALDKGCKHAISKDPEYEVFIIERFEECKNFILHFNINNNKLIFSKSKPENEKLKELSLKISEISEISEISLFDSKDDIDEELTDKEFLIQKSFDYDKLILYIKDKNITDVLVNLFCIALIGDTTICNNFISILFSLVNSEYKQNLIDSIQNEEVIDLINYDAPYIKEKINILNKKLSIKEI